MADIYFPGTPPIYGKVPDAALPAWLAYGWLPVDPNAPVPPPAGDPFPQYVTQAELEDFIPPLLANPASKVGAAGRAASVSAVQAAIADGTIPVGGGISVRDNGDGTATLVAA